MDPIEEFRGAFTRGKVFQPGTKACNKAVINRDGDLLFVASANVIYGYNLLTEVCFRRYEGHEGMIDDVDVDSNSKYIVSVGSDGFIVIHDIETGEEIIRHDQKMLMRCCCFAPHGEIAVVSSTQMKQQPILSVYHIQTRTNTLKKKFELNFENGVNCIVWPVDTIILAGDVLGKLILIESMETKEISKKVDAHRGAINSITVSFDNKFIATASADTTACTWDLNLEKIGTFPHSFLVSCAAISPNAPHIVLASSADKKSVAQTNFGSTDFTINFFHLIFQEEFASMKVHKSTINWVGFTPDGMTLVTTSQEGTFMIIRLGSDYQEMKRNHILEIKKMEEAM